MKHFLCTAVLWLAAFLVVTSAARAETVAQALQRGDADAARAALNAQVAGRPDAGLHRAHLEGMIALRQGDAANAITIFRAILDVAPDFEPSRLWLIRAHQAAGQGARAMAQARRLAAQTEDTALRDQLLDQVAAAQGPRRSGIALRFALLPSSNLTGGTSTETVVIDGLPFTLDEGSRKASGIGVTFGATAWRSWALGPSWTAIGSASLDHRKFNASLKPDETDLALRLDAAYRGEKGSVAFGPRLSLLFQDGERVRRQAGLGLSATYLATPRLRLFVTADLLQQRFPKSPFRDGIRASATPGLQWALSQRTMLTLETPILRETAQVRHLAHTDLAFGVGLTTRLDSGLHLGVGALVGRNSYDGNYPGFSFARRDRVRSLRLSLSHDQVQLRGLVPELGLTRKWQSSTIPLHRMTRTDVSLSLSRRF